MKKGIFSAALVASIWCLQLFVFAEEAAAQAEPSKWGVAGRLIGYFLLILAVIYAALQLTVWIGKKFGKH